MPMPNSPPIPLRQLGRNGPMVPSLGFGTMGLTYDQYGTLPSEEEQFAVLDRAYEIGARFWDSADLYGDGEALIGRWLRRTGRRDDIFLATKFGFVKGSPSYAVDSSAEYCKQACDQSLKALGIGSIDLYYVHQANPKTPIEETMRALAELQKEGKIKHIGLSNVSSATLKRAVKIAPVAAVQSDYSPFVLDVERASGTDLLATCRELGVALVAAMPLGRGMVTSTFAAGGGVGEDVKDRRTQVMPRFQDENRAKNVEVIRRFKALSDARGCTPAQLSLAWLLKQGNDIIPIPGTKRIKYLEENFAAVGVKLTDEDEAEIRRFVENAEVGGETVPPAFASYYFADTVEEGSR